MTTENEELIVQPNDDGGVTVGTEAELKSTPADDDDDERVAHASEADTDDEQGHAEETAEEAEARRERNRQRRKENKDRRKDYIEGLKRELAARDSVINDLNQRVSVVERRSSGSEMAQLEHAEKEAVTYYNHFKELNAKAIEQANGPVANDAQEKMYLARQRLEQIANIKKAMQQKQAAPAPLDARVVTHAQRWMDKNNWYNPQGADDDSAVVLSIDNRLAAEGWNPTTEEYWKELDLRVKKYLPHRIGSGYNNGQGDRKPQLRSPVAGSGRESSGNKSTGYVLSPDRVQAIKDAGKWDDPKAREQMIRRYKEYDKTQGAN